LFHNSHPIKNITTYLKHYPKPPIIKNKKTQTNVEHHQNEKHHNNVLSNNLQETKHQHNAQQKDHKAFSPQYCHQLMEVCAFWLLIGVKSSASSK
jgi:hypothetical protein